MGGNKVLKISYKNPILPHSQFFLKHYSYVLFLHSILERGTSWGRYPVIDWTRLKGIFNRTMTFRRDSDIVVRKLINQAFNFSLNQAIQTISHSKPLFGESKLFSTFKGRHHKTPTFCSHVLH